MDKVFIEDLEVETIIGIFGWEREVKQIVKNYYSHEALLLQMD